MKTLYRSPRLLELAKGERCLLLAVSDCLGYDGSTTVAAHSNLLADGKGRGIKASDARTVWACKRCHTWLDEGYSATRAEKRRAFEAAHSRQITAWEEMADNPTIKPWRREVAREALEHVALAHIESTSPGV